MRLVKLSLMIVSSSFVIMLNILCKNKNGRQQGDS